MAEETSLKWQKILWAVVVTFAITLIAYIRYNTNGILSFSVSAYYIWPYVIAATFFLLLFRVLKIIISREAFIYILMGVLNLYIGVVGVYLTTTTNEKLGFGIRVMFYLNLLIALVIYLDVFGKRGRV